MILLTVDLNNLNDPNDMNDWMTERLTVWYIFYNLHPAHYEGKANGTNVYEKCR